MDEMEMAVAYHCAPALAGIKPSNLISFCSKKHQDTDGRIESWNAQLNASGIYFEKMCDCSRSVLVLVYRKEKLKQALTEKDARRILVRAGYPVSKGLQEVLGHLKKRLAKNGEFPHEVGIFLGYPPEDVDGFVRCGGKGYKLNGYWKVYANEKKAEALFERYTKCRNAVCARLHKGASIARLFAAA